jgi:hypothetical protein
MISYSEATRLFPNRTHVAVAHKKTALRKAAQQISDHKRHWTPEEEEFLLKSYESLRQATDSGHRLRLQGIADTLGRTNGAVRAKLYRGDPARGFRA